MAGLPNRRNNKNTPFRNTRALVHNLWTRRKSRDFRIDVLSLKPELSRTWEYNIKISTSIAISTSGCNHPLKIITNNAQKDIENVFWIWGIFKRVFLWIAFFSLRALLRWFVKTATVWYPDFWKLQKPAHGRNISTGRGGYVTYRCKLEILNNNLPFCSSSCVISSSILNDLDLVAGFAKARSCCCPETALDAGLGAAWGRRTCGGRCGWCGGRGV